MQPTVKDTKKDAARPSHPDTHSKETGERTERERINKVADEAASRGLERQRRNDRDIISDSDPHSRD